MRTYLRTRIAMKTTAICLLTVPALAACGNDGTATSGDADDRTVLTPGDEESHSHDGTESEGHSHDDTDGHSHEHTDSMAGDPDATPANDIPGADLAEGHFELLADAPAGSPEVAGHVWLAQTDDGTTLSIGIVGLEAGTDYMSHLHAESCEPNDGGDHFKFDPDGSDQPPNEVHLAFTADEDGKAATTITNDNPDSDGARSMVLHLADGTKFACADLG